MAKQRDADSRESIVEDSAAAGSPSEESPKAEPTAGDELPQPSPSSEPESESEAEATAETGPQRAATSVDELEDSLQDREEDSDAEGESAVTREDQLVAQVERLQAESDAHRDKWLRAMAEFENFRKRSRREFDSSINLARAGVLKQLLEVVDNLERALEASPAEETSGREDLVKGVELIRDQLLRILAAHEVVRIEAVGREFDPNLHEAVSQIETDEVPTEHVAAVVQEGYQLGDMVLRPAVVVVAR